MPTTTRRQFFQTTSLGLLASLVAPGCWTVAQDSKGKSAGFFPTQPENLSFTAYRPKDSLCPIQMITPGDAPYMQTFYDVSPFSPNGRYVVLTRLPYQYKSPPFGDKAEVCIIDLESRTLKTVYATKAWAHQLGSNVQWGSDNQHVYTNDWIGDEPVRVRINIETGETKAYAGSMYHLAPDASGIAGFPPDVINVTQMGYGTPENPDHPPYSYKGAPDDCGLFYTDLSSNQKKLILSLADFKGEYSDARFDDATVYLFHTKFNPPYNRLLQVVRCLIPGERGWNPSLHTFDPDGGNLKTAVRHTT